jgi:short-subunit dehydrogenase
MRPVTLVTGASAGLGAEFARQCAARGDELVLVARRRGRLEALAEEIGGNTTVIDADLAIAGAPERLMVEIALRDLTVSTLINNAGFGLAGQFADQPRERHRQMLDLNIATLTELTHIVLPQMRERRAGAILNVASTGAFQAGPGFAVYFATKAYVLSFTEALHQELKGSGIKVSALCPGPTATEFGEVAGVTSERFAKFSADAQSVVAAGLKGLDRNRAIVIPGLANKLSAQSNRVIPRGHAQDRGFAEALAVPPDRWSSGGRETLHRNRDLRKPADFRLAEDEALDIADAEASHRLQFLPRLDAFGNHRHPHLLAERLDRFDDHPARHAAVDPADEVHVDLHHVGLKVREQSKPGMACPKIVDRGCKAERLIGFDDRAEMIRINALVLRELENEPIGRKAGCPSRLKRQLDAGQGRVNRIREEVDRQARVAVKNPRRDCFADGGYAAFLVEGIAVLIIDLRQDASGAFAGGAADERFIGKGPAGFEIDDRVKGRSDFEG